MYTVSNLEIAQNKITTNSWINTYIHTYIQSETLGARVRMSDSSTFYYAHKHLHMNVLILHNTCMHIHTVHNMFKELHICMCIHIHRHTYK